MSKTVIWRTVALLGVIVVLATWGTPPVLSDSVVMSQGTQGCSWWPGDYSFTIGPGGSYSRHGTLSALAPNQCDSYGFTVTSPTLVFVEVVASHAGDTICGRKRISRYKLVSICATAPATAVWTGYISGGGHMFGVGFAHVTGTFPAGYDVYVYGNAPPVAARR